SRRDRHLRSPIGGGDGAKQCGRVAQLVERPPEKRKVTGSTPVPTTTDDQAPRLVIACFRPPTGTRTCARVSAPVAAVDPVLIARSSRAVALDRTDKTRVSLPDR